ncbi:MAG: hypothetical protein A3C30_01890 [Candidatus Levybacteria bacterium RIFCSPHIGHO2_02_FULL_40_18]|nr:MAG: hypothetical protein A2869_04270 [Candidatus Levybacteria bacterium RIFCSPHIGHO2_01_FULL_40_58]OGH26742.1 MAG: hypothetical protein A3C30_01890 [Candidatus Levybacteria bacterium RIFCSPHIGHO2_02_FULL_40_18]OGH31677.1 MAG: hypothetical protein A3E43_01610 [Candidatus Levybacteria bacterium RIFCSPHIGHO2_12_FULL_40_31]OGH40577.1 MAG: hypothetical protein A2894_00160 [Candidatus Levybacteria bacterium RIFCSPLOWO2_01_FULL_40_64]OGH48752.1 MAG: hypothetical protein A3I54_03785 [Candidatus Lev
MANAERRLAPRVKEIAFRGAEVIAIGLAIVTAIAAGITLVEGDLVLAKKAAVSATVYALIAGGIIYAEKHIARGNSTPPKS